MRLTTILCQLTGTFAGFLSTVRYLPAVALVSYLFDRSDSLYAAFLKIFVLVQGTHTPLVIRHDRRTKKIQPSWRRRFLTWQVNRGNRLIIGVLNESAETRFCLVPDRKARGRRVLHWTQFAQGFAILPRLDGA